MCISAATRLAALSQPSPCSRSNAAYLSLSY